GRDPGGPRCGCPHRCGDHRGRPAPAAVAQRMMISGTTAGSDGAPTSPPDRDRLAGIRPHRSWLALVAALGACALVLALPQPKRSQPTNAPPVQTLSGVWPGVAVVDAKGV